MTLLGDSEPDFNQVSLQQTFLKEDLSTWTISFELQACTVLVLVEAPSVDHGKRSMLYV